MPIITPAEITNLKTLSSVSFVKYLAVNAKLITKHVKKQQIDAIWSPIIPIRGISKMFSKIFTAPPNISEMSGVLKLPVP